MRCIDVAPWLVRGAARQGDPLSSQAMRCEDFQEDPTLADWFDVFVHCKRACTPLLQPSRHSSSTDDFTRVGPIHLWDAIDNFRPLGFEYRPGTNASRLEVKRIAQLSDFELVQERGGIFDGEIFNTPEQMVRQCRARVCVVIPLHYNLPCSTRSGVTTRMSNAVDANWTLGVVGGHSTDLLPELVGKWNDHIILEPRETKETPLREKCEWFTRRVDVAVAWSGPQKNPLLDIEAGRWGAELRHALDELQTPHTAENFLSNSSGQGRVPSSERERSIRGILTMWRWQLEGKPPERLTNPVLLGLPTICYGSYSSFSYFSPPELMCSTPSCVHTSSHALRKVLAHRASDNALQAAVEAQQACVRKHMNDDVLRGYYERYMRMSRSLRPAAIIILSRTAHQKRLTDVTFALHRQVVSSCIRRRDGCSWVTIGTRAITVSSLSATATDARLS